MQKVISLYVSGRGNTRLEIINTMWQKQICVCACGDGRNIVELRCWLVGYSVGVVGLGFQECNPVKIVCTEVFQEQVVPVGFWKDVIHLLYNEKRNMEGARMRSVRRK